MIVIFASERRGGAEDKAARALARMVSYRQMKHHS